MIINILMKVGLMSMATGSALVIIVGTITAMHSEQAFAQNTDETLHIYVVDHVKVKDKPLKEPPEQHTLKDESLAHPPPETTSPNLQMPH
jgi:hypothetical protein